MHNSLGKGVEILRYFRLFARCVQVSNLSSLCGRIIPEFHDSGVSSGVIIFCLSVAKIPRQRNFEVPWPEARRVRAATEIAPRTAGGGRWQDCKGGFRREAT